jgi:hypothetical protein
MAPPGGTKSDMLSVSSASLCHSTFGRLQGPLLVGNEGLMLLLPRG